MNSKFSHIDEDGRPHMADVSAKKTTQRKAKAQCRISLPDVVLEKFSANEIHSAKGPVFQTAIVAGVMAAKKTGELIPLCHPLALDNVQIRIELVDRDVVIVCEASLEGKTGVEMEAMTGASVAALTVYDMCKALSHDIVISDLKLVEKTGGKNDFRR